MVSAILSPKEVRGNPEAEKAIIAEAAKLQKRIVWDEQSVEEWREVVERARRNGVTVHVGRVFAVVVVKNAELDPSYPLRKIKARLVFQGNEVRDQFGQIALYEQMSSSPATMQAAKCADAYGLPQTTTFKQLMPSRRIRRARSMATRRTYACRS